MNPEHTERRESSRSPRSPNYFDDQLDVAHGQNLTHGSPARGSFSPTDYGPAMRGGQPIPAAGRIPEVEEDPLSTTEEFNVRAYLIGEASGTGEAASAAYRALSSLAAGSSAEGGAALGSGGSGGGAPEGGEAAQASGQQERSASASPWTLAGFLSSDSETVAASPETVHSVHGFPAPAPASSPPSANDSLLALTDSIGRAAGVAAPRGPSTPTHDTVSSGSGQGRHRSLTPKRTRDQIGPHGSPSARPGEPPNSPDSLVARGDGPTDEASLPKRRAQTRPVCEEDLGARRTRGGAR